MVGRLGAILLALAGCRQILGIEDLSGGGDGGGADAIIDAPIIVTDASGADAGNIPVDWVACGGLDVLADDFRDASRHPDWTAVMGPQDNVAETTAGLLVEPSNLGSDSSGFIGYRSRAFYDGTRGAAMTEVTGADAGDGTREVLALSYAGGPLPIRVLEMRLANNLEMRFGAEPIQAIPYDEVQHRFWRIHVGPGLEAAFETSADGTLWVRQARYELSAAALAAFRYLQVEIGLDLVDTSMGVGSALFGGFNHGVLAGSHCLASSFSDSFVVPLTDVGWEHILSPTSSSTENGGSFVASIPGDIVGFPGARAVYVTRSRYTLAGSSVQIGLDTAQSTYGMLVDVSNPDGQSLRVWSPPMGAAPQRHVYFCPSRAACNLVATVPDGDDRLRFEGSSDTQTVTVQSGSGGGVLAELTSQSFDLRKVTIEIGAAWFGSGNSVASGQGAFTDYNF
jgi:hypothetical protein